MIWQDWAAFWAMGGYGLYVWGSLGVTLAALALELTSLLWQQRQLRRALAEQMLIRQLSEARA